jgi:hypothetical protein
MEPTSFRTHTLPLIGTGAVRVVPSAAWPQRVVLFNRGLQPPLPLADVFVSHATSELNAPGSPGQGTFVIESSAPGVGPRVVTVPAKQALYAAAAIAGRQLSVAVSGSLRFQKDKPIGSLPTIFRSFTLQSTGVGPAAIRLVPSGNISRRVVIQGGPLTTNIRITSAPEELDAFGAQPAYAYAFDGDSGPHVFILPPRQLLVGTLDPGSAGRLLSVAISEVPMRPMPGHQRTRLSGTRRYRFPAPFAPVLIAPIATYWQRIVVDPVPGGPVIAVAFDPNELTGAFGPGSFPLFGDFTTTFILAPGQGLLAASSAIVPGVTEVRSAASEALFDCCEAV